MLTDFIISRIKAELPFEPNEEKAELFKVLGQFLISTDAQKAFILRGYAGTGKTSVVSAIVKALGKLKQPCVLLAPTGRAAKVIAKYAAHAAYTIHKYIYRQKQLGADSFTLAANMHKHTLFIVDEASMISSSRQTPLSQTNSPAFGTGSLLDDLVRYVYSGEGCSLLILGDDAQLPPVGSTQSPALDCDYMRGYGLNISSFSLTQVARQALDSGILSNATRLRELLGDLTHSTLNDLQPVVAQDVIRLEGSAVVDSLERSYAEVGEEETLIITRSNKRTNLYNQGVRARILWKEDAISSGDRLMVSKNNYFWTQNYDNLPFLANGDILEVVRLRNQREIYGFQFADASLRSVDYDWEIDTILWLDTLSTESPEQNQQLQQTLFSRIAEDYPEIHNRKELVKKVYESEYYNALQVRFAYAVTCHKAQGGQWKYIYIDAGNIGQDEERMSNLQERKEYIRWLYTAITRATEKIYLIG
ncbi:MAG: AAA family ATPase [Bacteroidales bacterium]|nr:AAA family ATPase [Bacteroidales bacterium]